jgi:hypothetical protein
VDQNRLEAAHPSLRELLARALDQRDAVGRARIVVHDEAIGARPGVQLDPGSAGRGCGREGLGRVLACQARRPAVPDHDGRRGEGLHGDAV